MAAPGPKQHPFGKSEGLLLESSRVTGRLPTNFFETVCAFLDIDGDLIGLGSATTTA